MFFDNHLFRFFVNLDEVNVEEYEFDEDLTMVMGNNNHNNITNT